MWKEKMILFEFFSLMKLYFIFILQNCEYMDFCFHMKFSPLVCY